MLLSGTTTPILSTTTRYQAECGEIMNNVQVLPGNNAVSHGLNQVNDDKTTWEATFDNISIEDKSLQLTFDNSVTCSIEALEITAIIESVQLILTPSKLDKSVIFDVKNNGQPIIIAKLFDSEANRNARVELKDMTIKFTDKPNIPTTVKFDVKLYGCFEVKGNLRF